MRKLGERFINTIEKATDRIDRSPTSPFITGVARIFDFTGAINRESYLERTFSWRSRMTKTDEDALRQDWEAVSRDWQTVMGDMNRAIEKVGRESGLNIEKISKE